MKWASIAVVLKNPYYLLYRIIRKIPFRWADKPCVLFYYRAELGRFPNLERPKLFTEKLQWLKLNSRNPLYTTLVDKVRVKDYIAKVLGDGYCFKTLGMWKRGIDIDFDALPTKFVLKCNHYGGGCVFVCKNKSKIDITQLRRDVQRQLDSNMYLNTREWPYKNVERCVFAEEYMEDEFGELRDYKFYCFNGEPKMVTVVTDRFGGHYFTNFDIAFNELNVVHRGSPKSPVQVVRPSNFDEMLNIARRLSEGLPFVRIDLYNIKGRIFFGEFTFFPSSGHDDQNSLDWDKKYGSMLVLPTEHE